MSPHTTHTGAFTHMQVFGPAERVVAALGFPANVTIQELIDGASVPIHVQSCGGDPNSDGGEAGSSLFVLCGNTCVFQRTTSLQKWDPALSAPQAVLFRMTGRTWGKRC